MVQLRRPEIADGVFAGSPKYLLFMDQHAIAFGVGAFIIAIVIGIAITEKHETVSLSRLSSIGRRPFISATIDYAVPSGWGQLSG
jgi:hypothetical protein